MLMRGFMKRAAATLAAALILTLFAPKAGAANVRLSSQTLNVNGVPVRCRAYNIDGSNYFKLRDLAMLLRDTGSRFSVDYDGAKKAVMIATGQDYTPLGNELAAEDDLSATIRPTPQSIYIDGQARTDLHVYNIGGVSGSNFFKLRELEDVLGLHIYYDEETRTVYLHTRFEPGQARLQETADAGREYLDKIVFLGECTTNGIGYYYDHGFSELCPYTRVWTAKEGYMFLSRHASTLINYVATGEQLPIPECARRAKPEILIITLGLNGFGAFTESSYKEALRSLVESIWEASPATEVVLNTIYPVADSYKSKSIINNEKIGVFNGWIESLAEELGCRFLNGFEALAVDGKLPENLQNGDGLHLAGKAYVKVMEYIRTHALTLQ